MHDSSLFGSCDMLISCQKKRRGSGRKAMKADLWDFNGRIDHVISY